MAVIPVLLWPVQVGGVEVCDDAIAHLYIVDSGANFDDFSSCVGARDHSVLYWEWVHPSGDSYISVIQSNATDLDQDLMGVDLWNRLRMFFNVMVRALGFKTEDFLVWHYLMRLSRIVLVTVVVVELIRALE